MMVKIVVFSGFTENTKPQFLLSWAQALRKKMYKKKLTLPGITGGKMLLVGNGEFGRVIPCHDPWRLLALA